MSDLLSPLRYPGGKYILADYFETVINENLLTGCDFFEPYAGGASMSLCLLSRDVIRRATLVERDPLLYAFWKSVITRPDELCRKIEKLPVTLATWKWYHQRFLAPDVLKRYDLVQVGLAGLFFNRSNFSGIIAAGPIGGMSQRSDYKIDCRFNKARIIASIQEVAARTRKRLTVVYGDAVAYMRARHDRIRETGGLVYIDPPYLQQGRKLYRYHYQARQHEALAKFADAAKFKWIVSYDNHPFIRKIFRGQKIVPIFLNYAVKKSRNAEELLISNITLTPIVYEDAKGNVFEPHLENVG
jgi:DNA adenine methylase